MKFWIDAQLSPALAPWISDTFAIEAFSVQRLGLRNASDEEIFFAARTEKVVVLTKDSDFLNLLQRFGPPPQIVWITCGNIPNAVMREILHQHLPNVISRLQTGTSYLQIPEFT